MRANNTNKASKTMCCFFAAVLATTLSGGALAASPAPDPALIARMVETALPPVIGSDPELAQKLLKPKLAAPLGRTFSSSSAIRSVFGRQPPVLSADCERVTTDVGDPDPGDCVASLGEERGAEAFVRLSFSKNMGLGNISFVQRDAVKDLNPKDLKPTSVDNETAYRKALDWLASAFGLPLDEIPQPPPGIRAPYVADLTIGFDPASELRPVTVRKVVTLPRGLALGAPIEDRKSGRMLAMIPAPGRAVVAIDERGIVAAQVQNWLELRINPADDARYAKTRDQLVAEITEDLVRLGGGRYGKMSARIVYAADWRGSYGYLVPSVEIHMSSAPEGLGARELSEFAASGQSRAGVVRSYALIDPPEPDDEALR